MKFLGSFLRPLLESVKYFFSKNKCSLAEQKIIILKHWTFFRFQFEYYDATVSGIINVLIELV